MSYYVQVIDWKADEIVKSIGPYSKYHVKKAEDYLNRNLNHGRYYTTIVKGVDND